MYNHLLPLHFYILLFIYLRLNADMSAPKHMRQLTTWQVFYQVERRFHSHELNRQPRPPTCSNIHTIKETN